MAAEAERGATSMVAAECDESAAEEEAALLSIGDEMAGGTIETGGGELAARGGTCDGESGNGEW
jgi:hypothetical protein